MGQRVSAFTNDALGIMDATELAAAIARGEVSVTEVLEAAIQRAEKVNPELNAIVIKMYDDARKNSSKLSKGAFYGVPTFIKDSDPIAGYPTQLGTGSFKAKNANKNGKFVNQFLSTGLNCLGKTTLPEFGLICSTENERWGVTRNPWNTDYTTGGSSSGSAAMVASGVVPIASANDGGGSIRIPASICGLVGLKPSRFRLYPVDGAELMPVQIIHQGVLTRTVRDTALFFSEAEKYHKSNRVQGMGFVNIPVKQRLRIAFLENPAQGSPGYQDADTRNTQLQVAQLLESLGHTVEEVALPINREEMIEHFLHYYGFMSYMVTHWSGFTLKSKVDHSVLEPFTTGLYKIFKAQPGRFFSSIRAIRKIGAQAESLYEKYDVVMSPVLSHKTPKIGYLSPQHNEEEIIKRVVDFATYTGLNNVTGSPAISLPLGVDSDDMPLGVHFTTRHGNDKLLLELAYELEAAKPWRSIYQTIAATAV